MTDLRMNLRGSALVVKHARRGEGCWQLNVRFGSKAGVASHFSEGLVAYRARRWDEALRAFVAALESVPNDGPSKTFIKRIDSLMKTPPSEDWDGSWRLAQK